MTTVWEYSLLTEAERLIHCAHQIAVGFYKSNNFLVLPYNPKVNTANIVTFPDLPYNQIPRFWEKVKKVDVNTLPIKAKQELISKVSTLLQNITLPQPNYLKTEKLWQAAEKEILSQIYKILPGKAGFIEKITIHPTMFGTSCSFSWIDLKKEIIIYLREDQGIHTITEAIITSLTRKDIYEKLEGLWQESEIITDFLITQTSLANILQKYERVDNYLTTIKGVRIKQQARLTAESNTFYHKLGILLLEKPFSYNGLIPELFSKPLQNLTATERKVLLALIKNSNEVTTIDEIADNLDLSDAKFSLYAIAKLIQRLRNKLEDNGISGSYIQTLRSKGYLLKN